MSAKNKPRVFRGTRDEFGGAARRRLRIIADIRSVFESFGFEPLETPAIERNEVLSGKYGEEGEKKRFKLATAPDDAAGLRYDHTVPLARFLAINSQSLPMPYRRYVIGPVWRNEDPGARLRQFTQCDFDTAGSNSLLVDAEIPMIFYSVFQKLGFTNNSYTILVNDRRLLNAMAAAIGAQDKAIEVFRAWDKLEKISLTDICAELVAKGLSQAVVRKFSDVTIKMAKFTSLNNSATISELRQVFPDVDPTVIDEVENLFSLTTSMGVPETVIKFSPTLARGLDYYTGPIFEVVVTEKGVGSIAGGGRYDNLVESLGGPSLPASGASFGLERVIQVMEQLGLNNEKEAGIDVFVTVFDPSNLELTARTMMAAQTMRLDGLKVEVYTGRAQKLGKQFEMANRRKSPFAAVIGSEELESGELTIKNMQNGRQYRGSIEAMTALIKSG